MVLSIDLDFKNAFDSVPHRELLHKLRSVGVLGSLWKWFKNYLASRLQCVAKNGSVSQLLPVMSGVPQGSILGPLLFIIYISDLPVVIQHSTILLFADDTKCAKSVASQSEYQQLQNDLDSLDLWSHTWNLPFNENKNVDFFNSQPMLLRTLILILTPSKDMTLPLLHLTKT